MRLSELEKKIDNIEVFNDSDFNALGMATSEFEKYGVLSFLENPKFATPLLENKMISCIITTKDLVDSLPFSSKLGILITDKPKEKFYEVHNFLSGEGFYNKRTKTVVGNNTYISPNAIIAENNVEIGDNCIIEDKVIVYENVKIGNNVIIRSGAVISSNGFQFLNNGEEVIQVKSSGSVLIEDNVEIQHNCCVDRGVLGGQTTIRKHCKIDNLVHIAHDVVLGERTFVTAGVKFGGRTVVGKDCWIGINATISNGLKIGNNVKVSLGSVVTRDVEDNKVVTGNFAIDHRRFIEFIKSIR